MGLLEGKEDDAYPEKEYAKDIHGVLSRGGFVVPCDDSIKTIAVVTYATSNEHRLSCFRRWIIKKRLAAKDPIAVIRSAAKDISGCHAFMSGAFYDSFRERVVGRSTPSFFTSPTTDAIIDSTDQIMSHLIGGASGSGKTMSLVGFGQKGREKEKERGHVFPVLFQSRDFETLLIRADDPAGGLNKDMAILERDDRNAKFLGALVALVEKIIPSPALAALRRPPPRQPRR